MFPPPLGSVGERHNHKHAGEGSESYFGVCVCGLGGGAGLRAGFYKLLNKQEAQPLSTTADGLK